MSRAGYPSDKQDQFVVRFPEGMRDEIAVAAKANGRSMNAEIVARLSGDAETLRDKFAGLALSGMIACAPFKDGTLYSEIASSSYLWADAMLAARKGGA